MLKMDEEERTGKRNKTIGNGVTGEQPASYGNHDFEFNMPCLHARESSCSPNPTFPSKPFPRPRSALGASKMDLPNSKAGDGVWRQDP